MIYGHLERNFDITRLVNLGVACLAICLPTRSYAADESLTALVFRGALERTVRNLDSIHVVAVTKGTQGKDAAGATLPAHVIALECWMSGDHFQYRVYSPTVANDPWWDVEGFEASPAPLTADNLDSAPGSKGCIRPNGEFRWALSIPMPPEKYSPYKSLYSRSGSLQRTQAIHLPLVIQNRNWAADVGPGSWFTVDHLLEYPLEAWKVVGPDEIDGLSTTLVEIDMGQAFSTKLRDAEDELTVIPILKAWFSSEVEKGYQLLRLESHVKYRLHDQEYPAEVATSSSPNLIYEAHDITQFAEGLHYPRRGREGTYSPDAATRLTFDPDRIAKALLSTGKYIDAEKKSPGAQREWYILDLKPIEPTSNLWFEPPNGDCVHNIDTDARIIAGLSEEESAKVFAKEGNSGTAVGMGPGPRFNLWRLALLSINGLIVVALLSRMIIVKRRKAA